MRFVVVVLALLVLAIPCGAEQDVTVTAVDFLDADGSGINAAGPVLVQLDAKRNRLVVANTLTSSLSVIDCGTGAVTNIPMGGRAFQHLKAEAMTIVSDTKDALDLLILFDGPAGGAPTVYRIYKKKKE